MRPTPDRPTAGIRLAVVLTHGLLTVGAVLIGMTWEAGLFALPVGDMLYWTSLALLLLFAWSLASWVALTRSWFDPYLLFLVAANLFNAGLAFLEVFRLNPEGVLPGLFAERTVLDSLFLVFLGLAGLHGGALCSVGEADAKPQAAKSLWFLRVPESADVRRVGWFLLLVSAGPAVYVLRASFQRVLAGGYLALYQGEQAVGVQGAPQILADFLVPATLFLLAGSKGSPLAVLVSAAVVLANAGCQLFLGYRYYAAMPVVAYLWVWHLAVRPVPKLLLAGAAAVLLGVVFPLVAATREVRGDSRLSVEYLSQAFSRLEAPAVDLVSEMGGTLRTVAHTRELVPEVRDFDRGMVYAYGALTVIPNLFWEVHPSVAAGVPSHWLIWAVDPQTAADGGSLGYSFIAEAYLNFGWLGTPLVTALIGLLYGRFALWGLRTGKHAAANLALVGTFCSFFTFYAREDIPVACRSLLWYSLGPYCLAYLFASLRRGPRHRRAQELQTVAGRTVGCAR